MNRLVATLAVTLVLLVPIRAGGQTNDFPFDFALREDFVRNLKAAGSLLFSMELKMGGHSSVHPLASDCEMHIAGQPNQPFAIPDGVVVEPPNLCKQKPPTAAKSWTHYADKKITGRTCTAVGFPRIFTEHASGGGGASNPDHVFELHPLTSLSCPGANLDFKPFLRVYKGMRHVQDTTADLRLHERQLSMRRHQGMLEFREEGAGSCGNFGVVALTLYKKEWVHKIDGGPCRNRSGAGRSRRAI